MAVVVVGGVEDIVVNGAMDPNCGIPVAIDDPTAGAEPGAADDDIPPPPPAAAAAADADAAEEECADAVAAAAACALRRSS